MDIEVLKWVLIGVNLLVSIIVSTFIFNNSGLVIGAIFFFYLDDFAHDIYYNRWKNIKLQELDSIMVGSSDIFIITKWVTLNVS